MSHEAQRKALIETGKRMGLKQSDLKVLSRDPYFVGSPNDYRDSQWVANLWDQMMSQRRKPLHLRGFHYWVQSKGIAKPEGGKYAHGEDPAKDWSYLLRCAQMARYLGIGEWQGLLDLKHPEPSDYDNYFVGHGLARDGELDIQTELNAKLEGLVDEFLNEITRQAPRYHTEGYQLWHNEIWVEKASMGFVIEPICKKYQACYQSLVGQSSVEKVEMLVRRAIKAAQAGKKVRIWYIADWDRYGFSMPVAVARKLEFFTEGENLDIKLTRLALNDDQIDHYHLPKAPKHGEAVVELDALEAIHPGELGKIVEKALRPYFDAEKPKLVQEENRRILDKAKQLVEEKLREPLEEVFAGLDLEGIANGFSLKATLGNFEPPKPGHDVMESDDWIFDSSLSYWAQLEKYKLYKASREEEVIE